MARDFMRVTRWGVGAAVVALVAGCGGGGGSESTLVNSNPIARDVQFGDGGDLRIGLAPYGGGVTSVVEQPDGKLVVAGYRNLEAEYNQETSRSVLPKSTLFVHRYLESGQVDVGFGQAGVVEFSVRGGDKNPIISQVDDGSLYVSALVSRPCVLQYVAIRHVFCFVGEQQEESKTGWVRVSPSGIVDLGEPNEGLAMADLPASIQRQLKQPLGQQIALPDGRYLVFESHANFVGQIYGWSLRRYGADGVQDASFGKDGTVSGRCNMNQGRVVIDAQKNIWVVAAVSSISSDPPASTGICLEKLTENGQPSSNVPEPVKTPLGANASVHDARLMGDDHLLVAVDAYKGTRDLKLLKYQMNGVLAQDYGTQGVLSLRGLSGDQMKWMGLRIRDEKGAVDGVRNGYGSDANVWARWLPDGSLDKRFASNGIATWGDLPSGANRSLALEDSKKRWLMQTNVQTPAEASVTLSRITGDSQ